MYSIKQVIVVVAALTIAGCASQPSTSRHARFQSGESVVFIRTDPARLAFMPRPGSAVNVRSTYLDNLSNTVHYVAGKDYVVDYTNSSLRRTPQSRIPDFGTNVLFGKEDFDHSKFAGYGNGPFLAFVDYTAKTKPAWPVQASQVKFLPNTLKKLRAGEKVTVVAFGDSITAGGEATRPELIYWQRWAHRLQRKYPRAKVEAINGATGGDTTANGLARLDEKVLKRDPDLVLIAFGMNDHNIPGFGVPLEAFAQNLRVMIDRIRERTKAEIVLVSPFPPNPKWRFGSHRMDQYAKATEDVAREKKCAYADVYDNWQAIMLAKKPEDLLGNNINHPNDFGHGIYFQVLERLGL